MCEANAYLIKDGKEEKVLRMLIGCSLKKEDCC